MAAGENLRAFRMGQDFDGQLAPRRQVDPPQRFLEQLAVDLGKSQKTFQIVRVAIRN